MTTVGLDPSSSIRLLSQQQSLDLLAAAAVGRIGFVSNDGVEIIPVGYRLGNGPRLFMMTQPWGILGQLAERGARCSVEVDHHSDTVASGWSVLMRGTLSRLDRPGAEAYSELDRELTAWPGYPDAEPVQFVPSSYSGRSVVRPS
jgi:nitroimidazol reductase NimA-like FMN-containing flavoprotein (pyridoxamine 5'-phosphate oxidase superfamily)